MTEAELIARQAKQIEELRDEVVDLRRRADKARSHIYCIGGPLNDNRLGYSKPQMVTFSRIADALDGCCCMATANVQIEGQAASGLSRSNAGLGD